MTRMTEAERTFRSWCEHHGGEFEISADRSRCEHPGGDVLVWEDPAFERQGGKMLVPWSGQSDTSDTIFFEVSHFDDVEENFSPGPSDALVFVDRDEFEFAAIGWTEEGYTLEDEGKY